MVCRAQDCDISSLCQSRPAASPIGLEGSDTATVWMECRPLMLQSIRPLTGSSFPLSVVLWFRRYHYHHRKSCCSSGSSLCSLLSEVCQRRLISLFLDGIDLKLLYFSDTSSPDPQHAGLHPVRASTQQAGSEALQMRRMTNHRLI